MMLRKFSFIFLIFVVLFGALVWFFSKKADEIVMKNSEKSIEELLVNYNSVRDYVGNYQKEEVYRLQNEGILSKDYFHPILLSSTFSAKTVNQIYNEKRIKKGLEPIEIKFASDHPRNPQNQTTPLESKILKQFNNNEFTKYSQIMYKDGAPYLFYAVPTKRTDESCVKCHSDPKKAPKGLVELYGDTNGFWEKTGDMRAVLVTIYPLSEEIKSVNKTLYWAYGATFLVFLILIVIVYKFMEKIEAKNQTLEKLNSSLDKSVQMRTKELDTEKNYLKSILDTNPSLILITNGITLKSANRSFFEFFGFSDMDQFKKVHTCICDYFTFIDNKKLSQEKEIEGVNWCKYIANDTKTLHTVEIVNHDKKYYFTLNATYLNDEEILLTLQDITATKDKERVMIQQTKMASMGEMLSNIAHQWRQPLSMISTLSTSVLLQSEHGILEEKKLVEAMEKINESTQYLSGTIDDFSSFFQVEKNKKYFKAEEVVTKALKLMEAKFKTYPMIIEQEICEGEIYGFEGEIVQVLLNLLNNACEILIERDIEVKIVKIQVSKTEENVVISVHDNGGGVDLAIKEKIFEPYFTTKHKTQGTGIGLYTSYELIHLHMDGDIVVENEPFSYGSKYYVGANFKVILPQKKS